MSVFFLSSREVLQRCNIGCRIIRENQQNHIYWCDFVLYHKMVGEFHFFMHFDILNQTLLIHQNNTLIHRTYHKRGLKCVIGYSCSYLATQYFLFSVNDLTCRKDVSLLQSVTTPAGTVNIEYDAFDWITSNSFIADLIKRPLYKRIINYVANTRGIYIKKWQIEAQKNYFNTSVNGGLPLIKKKDEIHEGTFMLHDIFHFLFLDPLITGSENKNERSLYIATRMMSEACTLVLADMLSIEISGIKLQGYDTTKRKIHPVFEGTRLNYTYLADIKKMMYINSVYCLFGNIDSIYSICKDNKAVEAYHIKYARFFSGDFIWNEKNIISLFSKYKNIPHMMNYFQNTYFPYYYYTTGKLAKMTAIRKGIYSFNKLFEILWSQFVHAIQSTIPYNKLQSKKIIAQKHLSGQLLLRYLYADQLSNSFNLYNFDKFFHSRMDRIQKSSSIIEVVQLFNKLTRYFVRFIEYLEHHHHILPHESFVYKLHVPQFDPEYIYYDNKNLSYEPLVHIGNRLIGTIITQEQNNPKPITKKLQNLYSHLIVYEK